MKLDHFPKTSLIAWDWDGTLSANGRTLDPQLRPILQYIKDLGLRQIIVSGRSPHSAPVPTTELMPSYSAHNTDPDYEHTGNFNPVRYKLWLLRTPLFKKYMLCYVDRDHSTITALIRSHIPAMTPDFLQGFLDSIPEDKLQMGYR